MIDLDLGTWAQDHIKMVGIHRVPTLTTENMSLIHEHMIEKSRVLLIKATDGHPVHILKTCLIALGSQPV